ncbi:PAS domain S-box protein [Thermodesulfobacteriota bacterium]
MTYSEDKTSAALKWLARKGVEELRYTHDYTHGIFDISPDALVVISKDGKILKANEEMAKLTDSHREELIGNQFSTYFNDEQPVHNAIKMTLEKGKVSGCELILKSKNNTETVISFSAAVNEHSSDIDREISAVLRNITRRAQIKGEVRKYVEHLELMVREADQRYKRIFENSKDTIYATSRDGKIIDINQAGVTLLGYESKEEMLALPCVEYIYSNPDERKKFIETIERDGFVKDYEIVLKRKDGKSIYTLITSNARTDDQGNPLGYEGIIRDITEKKRHEEQLEFLANVLRNSRDAIIGVDLHFLITSWNKGAELIYGFTENEAVGNGLEIIVPDHCLGECKIFLGKVCQDQAVERHKTARQRKDGTLIDVELSFSPIRDRSRKIVGASILARPL